MAMKPIEILINAAVEGEDEIRRLLSSLDATSEEAKQLKQQADQLNGAIDGLAKQQEALSTLRQLGQESRQLGQALGQAAKTVDSLGTDLAASASSTKQFAAAQSAAQSALNGAQAELAQQRQALKDIQSGATAAAKGTDDYKTAVSQAKAKIAELAAAVKEKKQALTEATQSSSAAASAEKGLQQAYDAAVNAARKASQSYGENARSMQEAREAAKALGIDTDQLGAAQKRIQQEAQQTRQAMDAYGTAVREAADKSKALEASARAQAAASGAASTATTGHSGAIREMGSGMDAASQQIVNAKNQLLAFAGVSSLAQSVQDVAKLADQWVNMQARLKLALGAQTDINQAMGDVEAIAKRTYTSLDATANLYGKIAVAGREMGVSQQQALALTESINQSIQLSGASAQVADAAVTQFIQGLQSGVIRGDEFNSIMEQSPRLAQAMADGLKVPIGALRGLAEAGQLSSTKVIAALQSQSEAINREFGSLPLTIGRAVQNLQTEWLKFVGTLDSSTGASSAAAAGIESIATHLDDLARVAAMAGTALVVSFAAQAATAMRAAIAEMAAAGGAATLLRTRLDALSRPVQITIAVVGLEIGYQIGTMLHENSELARKLGVGIVGWAQATVSSLQLIKDSAAAIFTTDTIDAAMVRFEARNKTMREIILAMWQDAENAPSKIGAAADSAGAKMGAMGKAATAAGAATAAAGAAGANGVANIGKAADQSRAALTALAAAVNTKAPPSNGLADITRDLQNAALRGEDLEALLRTNIPKAIGSLSGPELSKFRADFVLAMDAAKQSLQEAINTDKPRAEIDALRAKVDAFEKATRTGLGLIAEQAAQNLGIDVPLAFNKVSEAFTKSQSDLSVLIRSLPDLKAVGVDTAAVVGQALNGMIDGAKNQAELDAIKGRIEALREELGNPLAESLLDNLSDKADDLADALDKVTPGVQSVEEAMKDLGLTSEYTLGKTADKAKEAYETVKNSGVASADEVGKAFASAAEKAIAANKGLAPEWVKAEAAARGYKIEVDEAGKATLKLVSAQDSAAQAFAKAGEAIKAKTAAMKAESDLVVSGLELRKSELDASIKIAEANGDEAKAIKLKIEQKRIEIQIIQETVKAQIAEAQASADMARAKMAELQATGSLTAEKKAELQSQIKGAEATINQAKARGQSVRTIEEEIKALQASSNGYDKNASSINQTTAALEKMNAAREKEIAAQEKKIQLDEREQELYRKKWQMDKEGYSVDANGDRIQQLVQTPESLYNEAKGAGLTAEQARQLSETFAPKQGQFFDNNKFWKTVNQLKQYNDWLEENKDTGAAYTGEMPQDFYFGETKKLIKPPAPPDPTPAPTPSPAPIRAPAPAPAPRQPQQPSGDGGSASITGPSAPGAVGGLGNTYISNITLPGVGRISPRFADGDSQAQVEGFLRALAAGKGVAQ